MVLSLAPSVVYADQTDVDMSEMNALEAIGFDTSKAPEGFDANDTSNPYGRDSVTMNPVDELLVLRGTTVQKSGDSYSTTIQADLYGNYDGTITVLEDFLSEGKTTTTTPITGSLYASLYKQNQSLGMGIETPHPYLSNIPYGESTPRSSWAAMAAAAANFDGNQSGQKKQYALVTLEYEKDASTGVYAPVLKLQTVDALDGLTSNDAKTITLISDFSKLGNSDEHVKGLSKLNQEPTLDTMKQYDLQNYVKVATGDFNGDGLDEIAVYVPDTDNPRIEVYQYEKTTGASGTSYQNMEENWALVWTYSLSKTGKGIVADANGKVPNMVSLLAADINRDGIDDLAITYGYYHGTANTAYTSIESTSIQSRAAVLYGSRSNANLLTAYDDFAVQSSDGEPIVRAAFTYGPLVGVDEESLVLGGQSESDLKGGKPYTRYAAIYQYDGAGFDIVTDKNFDLFAKNDDGSFVYSCMERTGEIFLSLPYCPANLAVISNGLTEAATLYFDSLQLTYAETGLELKGTLDVDYTNWNDTQTPYTEYGAASADLFGYGYDAMAAMLYHLPYYVGCSTDEQICNRIEASVNIGTRLGLIVTEATPVAATEEETESEQQFTTTTKTKLIPTGSNAAYFIFPNTDNDTAYLKYNQNHYFIYSNPKVLAVLASSPYFEDLMNRDDLSGAYSQSETSYAKTEGSSDGAVASTSIWAGAYASLEQDITIFGIKIGSIEASSTFKAKFTYEFEMNSSLEQTVEYSTSVGSDAVVLYSIPTVVYEYTAYTPDGEGGYNAQAMTITSPHTASIQVMDLKKYEEIAKDYSELPEIAGNIITHTLGDPSTYPTSTRGYEDAIVWDGDYAAVGYTDVPNGQKITQTIDMSTEYSHAFVFSSEAEYTAGVGAGCLTVGVVAGGEAGAGYVMTSTSGSSYTASMQNMPAEAEDFGYGFSWKLFAYDGGGFPVVSYLVTDIEMPPELPDDFSVDSEQTTSDTIALTWSYDSMISGFQLYRYYDFPDGSGDYELAFVPFDQGKMNEDGTWDFVYYDEQLNPYTEYTYKIQAVRGVAPNRSIESEAMTVRTKTDVGYPEIELVGLDDDGTLAIYPDSTNTVAVVVKNEEDYPQGISYQWQKLENGNWVDLNNKKQAYYTFLSSGYSTEGDYRCRINVVYYDQSRGEQYFISSYSDVFHAKYRVHKAMEVSEWTADVTTDGKPQASVTLQSTTTGHKAAPTGIVSFAITGLNYSRTYNVSLKANGTRATASLTADMTSSLPEGVYTIEAYYQGSRVFSALDLGQRDLLSGTEGYRLIVCDKNGNEIDTVTYGEGWTAKLMHYQKDASGKLTATEIDAYNWKNGTKLYRMGGNGNWLLSANASATSGSWLEDDYGSGIDDYKNRWPWLAQTPCRSYKLMQTYDGYVCEAYFTVTRRPITVGITTANGQLTAAQGEVESNLPQLTVTSGSLVYGDKLQYDHDVYTNRDGSTHKPGTNFVDYRVYDTAGKEVTLDNNTAPGSYTVIGYLNISNIIQMEKDTPYANGVTNPKAADDEGQKYGLSGITYGTNYEVTFEPVTYVVTGAGYTLTVNVTNTADRNTAGTVSVLEPETHGYEELKTGVRFANGTSLTLQAEPYEGYQVKQWIVKTGNKVIKTQQGGNTLFYTMLAEDIRIELEYELVTYTLNVTENPEEGTVTWPVGFANGAAVRPGAEYTFTATANEGYTFKHWQYVVGGRIEIVTTPEITVTIGHADVNLYPIFERDSYALTLIGNLQASYKWDHDNDTSTADIDRYVTSGAEIPGDTLVTISAAPGYRITGGWCQDGTTLDMDGASVYSFSIKRDTTVQAETELETYDLTVECMPNGVGTVHATSTWIDESTGQPLDSDAFKKAGNVPGNTEFTLTAVPARGYVFSGWNTFETMDESQPYSTDETIRYLLQKDETLYACFEENTEQTVTGTFRSNRGTVSYKVLDRYGAVVDSGELTSGTAFTAYTGETVEITVNPKANYMVDKWTVNGQVENGNHSKTRTFENLTENLTFEIEFAPQSYYVVNYSVTGEGGTVSATSDDEFFDSGDKVGGGSTVVFTAVPETGKMVDKWTVNGVEIRNPKDQNLFDHGNTLTIDALSGQSATIEITVSFTDIKSYRVGVPESENDEPYGASNVIWKVTNTPRRATNEGPISSFYEGETIVYEAKPVDGYRIAELTGFDSAEQHEDGTWTCTIEAIGKDYDSISLNVVSLHNLTVDAALENGTVTIDEVKSAQGIIMTDTTGAAAGETVTVTATPADGFKLIGMTIRNSDDAEAPAQTLEGNTFTMPDNNVTVSAIFAPTHNPILCNPTTGGTVTANPTSAQVGETVSLTIEPDSGFQIDRITAVWMNGETPVELTVINYRFTMPDAPVSVTVAFSEIDDGGDSGDIGGGDSGDIGGGDSGDGDSGDIGGGDSGDIGGGDGGTATSTVTLTFETNGGQTMEPVRVDAGTTVDLADYVTTRTGYVFDGWYSDAALTTKVTEMQLQTDTTVYAKWEKATAGSSFTDVPDDSFYNNAVEWAVEEGVTNGVGDNLFAPNRICTRSEIVVFLWRLAGSPEPKGTLDFDDVPAEAYYAKAVYWAAEQGITNGVGGNLFAPEQVCDRSQIVTFLWRFAGSPEASVTGGFEDVPAGAFYAKAVNWAVQQGITNGVGNNLFAPTMECTRSQAVTFLYRYENPEKRLQTTEK